MSDSSKLGSRGRLRAYQLPMPADLIDLLQTVSEEMQLPGFFSLHIEQGAPITIHRYVDVDDLLTDNRPQTPQELVRQIEPLIELPKQSTPHHTFLYGVQQIQAAHLKCSAIIVGSLEHFLNWLQVEPMLRPTLYAHDQACDFYFMGIRGYTDDSLDADKLVLFGGATDVPVKPHVRMALHCVMDLE